MEAGRALSAPILTASSVGKRYALGPARTQLTRYLRRSRQAGSSDEFWAVRDVSFELPREGSLGLIGRNGAGKSTLLRLLAGTAKPTEGSVECDARLACVLDLGVGFQPLETGRQNAEAALALDGGYSKSEIPALVREIEAFAEIGAYFDRPIRTYSDGMRLRLAFATITVLRPEVLVTDEVIVVGDSFFQEKCRAWFDRFLADGGSLVLCAHDLGQIQQLCTRTLWLDGGRVAEIGDSREVIRSYREAVGAEPEVGNERAPAGTTHETGHSAGLLFEVVELHLRDEAGAEVRELAPDATVVVEADIRAPAGVPHVHFGITTENLTPVFGVSSDMGDAEPTKLADDLYRYRLRFDRWPLGPGRYRLRAHAIDETGTRLYDTVEIHFSVAGSAQGEGLVRLRSEWHPDQS